MAIKRAITAWRARNKARAVPPIQQRLGKKSTDSSRVANLDSQAFCRLQNGRSEKRAPGTRPETGGKVTPRGRRGPLLCNAFWRSRRSLAHENWMGGPQAQGSTPCRQKGGNMECVRHQPNHTTRGLKKISGKKIITVVRGFPYPSCKTRAAEVASDQRHVHEESDE